MRYVFARLHRRQRRQPDGVRGAARGRRRRLVRGLADPETLRATTFADKAEGAALNIEIERQTQVFVDTVRDAIDERLGPLAQALETLLRQQGLSLDDVARPVALPPR